MQQKQSARQNYLQAEVHTATPQKLQLMLIEAAIKNIHRTKQAWNDLRYDDGIETLSRAQDIIAEILCSLDKDRSPEIAPKLASIYLFIFRRLAESGMSHDEQKLEDALRVLNSERETWRLVCEKFGSTVGQTSASGESSVKLDFAKDSVSPPTSGTKVLVPPTPPPPTSGTFTRSAFGQSVKPLGAGTGTSGGIQTDTTLAGAKPLGKTPLNVNVPPPQNPPRTGKSWDV
jgi:flagellar protein FliS